MAKSKRRRKLKKGPVIILITILLLLIFFLIFLIYTNTSKYLFFKGINDTYNNINEMYEDFLNNYLPYSYDNYLMETDSSFSVKTNDIDKSVTFKGSIYMNGNSNYFDLDIGINKINYSLELLPKDNKLYYKIDESKYYYIDEESTSFSTDYNKLVKTLIKVIKANVSNSDFNKTREDIEINDKKYNTKKISLNITNDMYYKIMKDFYNKVKASDELVNSLYNITSYESKDTLLNYIDYFINNDNYEEKKDINYSIYLYKSKPIMNNIIYDEYDLSLVTLDEYLKFNYREGEEDSYLVIDNKEITFNLVNIGKGNGTLDNSNIKLNLYDYSNSSLFSLNYTIKENNNKYDTTLEIISHLELIDLEFKSSNEITINKTIPKIDLSSSINSNNMNEDEQVSLNELLSLLNDIAF